MFYRNKGFLSAMGEQAEKEFEWVEGFLEQSSADWSERDFRQSIESYFDRLLSLMRSESKMDDLR